MSFTKLARPDLLIAAPLFNGRRRDRRGVVIGSWAQRQDIIARIEATGAVVVAAHLADKNVRAIGGVVAYQDDARALTHDGAFFLPGVGGEGMLGGDVAAMNALAGLTVGIEFTVSAGTTTGDRALFYRRSNNTATTDQFSFYIEGSSRFRVIIGDGVSTRASVRSAASSITAGVTYFAFARFDGTAGTDATKVTFWIATYDRGSNTFSAVAQSASSIATAGVPAALITLVANISLGRQPDAGGAPFVGLLGNNGTRVRVWNSALTEAQMNAEVASSSPVTPPILAYNFSGSAPLTNLGTAGAVGDLTVGANTVLVSGDRTRFGRASAGSSRPTYDTSGVTPAVVFPGTNQYLRNVARGQLESVTADGMIVHIGTIPSDTSTDKTITALSSTTTNALSIRRREITAVDRLVAQTSATAAEGALTTSIPSGSRVVTGYRTSNVAGTSGLRLGLDAEIEDAETPASSTAVTRCTDGANAADTPASFGDMSQHARLVIRNVTDANVRQQIAEICDDWMRINGIAA